MLGLFDGIATGLLVLKELGVEVERYVASEVDQDAIYVSKVQHNEIIHVGCIERVTEKEVCLHLLNTCIPCHHRWRKVYKQVSNF